MEVDNALPEAPQEDPQEDPAGVPAPEDPPVPPAELPAPLAPVPVLVAPPALPAPAPIRPIRQTVYMKLLEKSVDGRSQNVLIRSGCFEVYMKMTMAQRPRMRNEGGRMYRKFSPVIDGFQRKLPEAKEIYVPPGCTTNFTQWDTDDVGRWLDKIIRNQQHLERLKSSKVTALDCYAFSHSRDRTPPLYDIKLPIWSENGKKELSLRAPFWFFRLLPRELDRQATRDAMRLHLNRLYNITMGCCNLDSISNKVITL